MDELHFLSFFNIRKDDWPEKRMGMDDRYGRSDFTRQDRYQDFDHRDRGRYQDDMMMDRRDNNRGIGADRDGQVRDVDSSFEVQSHCSRCIWILNLRIKKTSMCFTLP